jgi:hypothetical protein
MTTPDFRALCAELFTAIQLYTGQNPAAAEIPSNELIGRLMDAMAATAAALAQPEPVGPTDEELNDTYWKALDRTNSVLHAAGLRAVLARYCRPAITPIPVSERLPGPEDCDAEGRCWVGSGRFTDDTDYGPVDFNESWELCRCSPDDCCWLPANALPLPEGGAA